MLSLLCCIYLLKGSCFLSLFPSYYIHLDLAVMGINDDETHVVCVRKLSRTEEKGGKREREGKNLIFVVVVFWPHRKTSKRGGLTSYELCNKLPRVGLQLCVFHSLRPTASPKPPEEAAV